MADTYTINYEDPRFGKVEADKQQAMTELDETYSGMISESDKYYQDQINATKEWANTQQQLQQERTDFTIEKIEQQKEQAHKDYVKEQSGAYVDYQKQSNLYGVNAEQQAAAGMQNTGFSESSQVSMYNTYQNRVAVARESYNNAVLNYNNAIKDAQLQNNSALAEIAFEALKTQLDLSIEGFQYKNSLIIDQTDKKIELDNEYHNRYLAVLDQLNTENALAEDKRQFDANYALQEKEFAERIRQFNQDYNLRVKEFNEEVRQYNQSFNEQVRQFDLEIERLKKQDAHDNAMEIQQLEFQKQQLTEQKRQHDEEMGFKKQQLEEEKRQFNDTMALQKTKTSTVSGNDSTYLGSYLIADNTRKETESTENTSTEQQNNVLKPVAASVPKSVSVNGNTGPKVSPTTLKTAGSSNYEAAYKYFSDLKSTGANRYIILSEIETARSKGELTTAEANRLKQAFVTKGS